MHGRGLPLPEVYDMIASNTEQAVSVAFMAATDLALALGAERIDRLPGAWVHSVDGNWTIAINGHGKAVQCEPLDCVAIDIPPFHMAVWWNGFIAGLLTPFTGTLAAGDLANEDTFIAALKAAHAEAL